MTRHPGVENCLRWLVPNSNLPASLQAISQITHEAAEEILDTIRSDSPELTEGLRKLLEAKDCFVRASIIDKENSQ